VQAGDIVRFRPAYYIASADEVLTPESSGDWVIGLLIEYNKWEKIATILHGEDVLRVAARDVQRFGRRYFK